VIQGPDAMLPGIGSTVFAHGSPYAEPARMRPGIPGAVPSDPGIRGSAGPPSRSGPSPSATLGIFAPSLPFRSPIGATSLHRPLRERVSARRPRRPEDAELPVER